MDRIKLNFVKWFIITTLLLFSSFCFAANIVVYDTAVQTLTNKTLDDARLQAIDALVASVDAVAVYYGRVVFSDWLDGMGLLTIIDHGAGYMSLYGHNQDLLKEVGEWVDPGEAIGHVGDSGGQAAAGLYFEIRKDGKPVNPKRWIR